MMLYVMMLVPVLRGSHKHLVNNVKQRIGPRAYRTIPQISSVVPRVEHVEAIADRDQNKQTGRCSGAQGVPQHCRNQEPSEQIAHEFIDSDALLILSR